ncbi:MAG: hypothetical protein WCE99_12910, partial [Nitrososphaeraceae archaeon]
QGDVISFPYLPLPIHGSLVYWRPSRRVNGFLRQIVWHAITVMQRTHEKYEKPLSIFRLSDFGQSVENIFYHSL